MTLPFKENSLDTVVCISAINYFSHARAQVIIRQVFKALRPGAVARFAVQDLEVLARRYVEKDFPFYCQTLPDGTPRFGGATLGDKFCSWFYAHQIGSNKCRYFYDFESLAILFVEAGFSIIEKRSFLDSRLDQVERFDNRPEQMFFLEAVK